VQLGLRSIFGIVVFSFVFNPCSNALCQPKTQMPSNIVLPTPVVNSLIEYLSQRPWAEVNQLMFEMQSCIAKQMEIPNILNSGRCPSVVMPTQHPEQQPIAPSAPNKK
jgi:hypothetical protein